MVELAFEPSLLSSASGDRFFFFVFYHWRSVADFFER